MANFNGIVARITTAIPELTNTSAASIWRRMVAVFSSVIDIVQREMARSQERTEYAARNLRTMGKQYYVDIAFAYQDGDPIVVVDPETMREGYAVIDAAKQIIKQVAISTPQSGQIYVKVATIGADGNLTALNDTQLTAFQAYMAHFTPIGMELTVFSALPDVFNAGHLYIRYNAEYSLTAIQTALRRVLMQFQTTFNADVPLYINDIEAAIKTIPGIRDVWFVGATATYTDAEGEHIIEPINGVLELSAGYFNFNPDIYNFDSGVTVFEMA